MNFFPADLCPCSQPSKLHVARVTACLVSRLQTLLSGNLSQPSYGTLPYTVIFRQDKCSFPLQPLDGKRTYLHFPFKIVDIHEDGWR